MTRKRIIRNSGTLLMTLAALCFVLLMLAPILIGSLGMDIHWTATREIIPHSALLSCVLALLVIPCALFWLGLRLRRSAR